MAPLSTVYTDLGTVLDSHGQPIASFRLYPEQQLLYIRWTGNLTGPEVIEVATAAGPIQQQYHCPLLLNDKTDSTGEWSEALPWLEYEWLPQAMKGGLRAFAYVFSPDMQNQGISMEFAEHVGKHLPIQLFYDVDAAWEWLRRQRVAA
ncbi:STAS/SEC14 domain-containing protein [Hymenobacter sp. BT635]|uniref:STAS/SEC14 domain-containing protein n=1 Tax=Hymenobacter nitidus TaxID=2880929 RepID=A0ABS8ABD0_9BACT|nr:STAS/SEC14 domain-containing protein [Hymenobacter nitidus]MCB2377695.1 STAS/SEC14 domain-containing protein [Hymenobacter nitidus]